MKSISEFYDWCFINEINMDLINEDIIIKYLSLRGYDNKTKLALNKYLEYIK